MSLKDTLRRLFNSDEYDDCYKERVEEGYAKDNQCDGLVDLELCNTCRYYDQEGPDE